MSRHHSSWGTNAQFSLQGMEDIISTLEYALRHVDPDDLTDSELTLSWVFLEDFRNQIKLIKGEPIDGNDEPRPTEDERGTLLKKAHITDYLGVPYIRATDSGEDQSGC